MFNELIIIIHLCSIIEAKNSFNKLQEVILIRNSTTDILSYTLSIFFRHLTNHAHM